MVDNEHLVLQHQVDQVGDYIILHQSLARVGVVGKVGQQPHALQFHLGLLGADNKPQVLLDESPHGKLLDHFLVLAVDYLPNGHEPPHPRQVVLRIDGTDILVEQGPVIVLGMQSG